MSHWSAHAPSAGGWYWWRQSPDDSPHPIWSTLYGDFHGQWWTTQILEPAETAMVMSRAQTLFRRCEAASLNRYRTGTELRDMVICTEMSNVPQAMAFYFPEEEVSGDPWIKLRDGFYG